MKNAKFLIYNLYSLQALFWRSPTKSYYFSTSKYRSVHRFWLCYSKILDAAYCTLLVIFFSKKVYGVQVFVIGDIYQKELNNTVLWIVMWMRVLCMNFGKKMILLTRNLKFIKKSFWKMVLRRLFNVILTIAKNYLERI